MSSHFYDLIRLDIFMMSNLFNGHKVTNARSIPHLSERVTSLPWAIKILQWVFLLHTISHHYKEFSMHLFGYIWTLKAT